MKKALLILLGALLAIGVASSVNLVSQGQKKSKEEPTLVIKDVISPKQKVHSELFDNHRGVAKLTDLIKQDSSNPDQELKITILPGLPELSPPHALPAVDAWLNKLAATSDAIVIGSVINKASQLTKNETFVFTDYDLSVEEVLKDRTSTIQPQSVITVTRPGGKVLLEGRIIDARDKSFKPIVIGGHFLLFLRLIPKTGSYQALNNKSSFELVNNKVRPLSDAPDAQDLGGDLEPFLSEIRAAIAAARQETRVL